MSAVPPNRSPLAPETVPAMPPVEGVQIATAAAGIKSPGRTDLLVMSFAEGTEVAGVFTQSKCPSAPVEVCRANLSHGKARALVVNSGNANAFTGAKGREATAITARAAAGAVQCETSAVYLASTGVIGEPLDAAAFAGLVGDLASNGSPDGWLDAGKAIMTTDTYPKYATVTVNLGGCDVVINGIAKGAGMIAPDMATMLGFIATDAPVGSAALQAMLSACTGTTFNAITVDSDTSTSDTVLAFATGAAAARGAPRIADADDPRAQDFRAALHGLMKDLALQIVRDGEGARKQVEIIVRGATSDQSARRIALSVANSPLVKTAVAGEDANWGRIVMAVGKAGEPADRDRLAIWFGGIRVAHQGERDPDYVEAEASAYMKRDEIVITVEIGLGDGEATVWTCDLTKEYVSINGDYRS